MKAVLLLFVAASCYALPAPDEWEQFKMQFSKSYANPLEDQWRKQIFLNNKKLVEDHNQKHRDGLVSYSLGLNNFSDLTGEEMKKNLGYGIRRP